jgi:predicted DNA binding CopG/RHH family protein
MNKRRFQTEAEEAAWIYDNRERLGQQFAEAMHTRDSLSARTETAKAKAINIRLAEDDLQLARDLAAKKGLPYQTYIKSLLHEALRREASR